MRRYFISFVAIILYLIPVAAHAQCNTSDAEIKAAIAKLDVGTDENGFVRFEILYKNPRRSTELLISSLKPARHGQYSSGNHPQVVWKIRALRSLTGVDFRAKTKSELDEDESHFLDRNAKGEVRLFGTWMSRDRVWVAPVDAQTAIITRWQDWFKKHGEAFTYVNDRNFDDWYF
jgi:hypothetical protein